VARCVAAAPEAIALDWDGTAVSDPRAYAPQQIELLTGLGVDVGVISGTHAENIDGQLQARPSGPGYLYLCVNRGSLIYLADSTDIHLVHRMASAAEEVALDRAAERTAAALQQRGLTPLVQPLRPLVCLCLARLTYERSRPPSTTTSAPVM
jgi:hydroxymethylpyrimidine pyrophosphatase-like HAD family hydrolase